MRPRRDDYEKVYEVRATVRGYLSDKNRQARAITRVYDVEGFTHEQDDGRTMLVDRLSHLTREIERRMGDANYQMEQVIDDTVGIGKVPELKVEDKFVHLIHIIKNADIDHETQRQLERLLGKDWR